MNEYSHGSETERVRVTQESVNFSKSNRHFTFGIGERFRSTIKHNTEVIGYDLPSTFGKSRTCSFGIGKRFKLRNNRQDSKSTLIIIILASPEPGAYKLISDFDIGNQKKTMLTKPGLYSFGIPHSYYKKVYIPGQKHSSEHPDAIPGPGQYNPLINTVAHEPQGALVTKF